MPRTLSFPPPSTATCPICAARLSEPRCGTCGASFTGEDGATLWRVDHDLSDLCRIRNEVVHRLLTAAAAAPADRRSGASTTADRSSVTAPTAPPAGSGRGPAGPSEGDDGAVPGSVGPLPPPFADEVLARPGSPWPPSSAPDPDGGPGRASAPPPSDPAGPELRPRPRPSFTAAEVLVGLGALSLVAAVAVFAAVSWSDLAAWAQGGLVVALTGAVLGAAVASRRRQLVATSEALGAVGVALALADVQVARVGLDGLVPGRWVWAVGLAGAAVGAIALGRRSGVRVLDLAGGVLAFAPVVVATSDDGPVVALWCLAAQAVVGGLVAAGPVERRSDRVVALVGAAVSWAAAVVGSLVLAAAGLAADPVAHAVGPAVVLAALAVATLVVARRLVGTAPVAAHVLGTADADQALAPMAVGLGGTAGAGRALAPEMADVLGGAGAAVALVPVALVALGWGSVLPVLTVLAAQGVLAVGWAGAGRASRGERWVLLGGGSVCGLGATLGLLALTLVRVVDDGPATGPALVLVALAVGAIAVGRARTPDLPLAAAGVAVSFAPALLLAGGTGSIVTLLVTTAVQAVVALAVAGRAALTGEEPAVARVGGWLCWIGAAAGALVHAAAEIADATDAVGPRTGALLVLAGLAAASVGVGLSTDRRDLTAAGAALAFGPVPLAVLGVVTPSTLVAVLLGEALVAALLTTVVDRGPVRTVVVAGGVVMWSTAVVGAGTLGLAGWLATPVEGPAGAVALLAALAALAVGTALVGGWGTPATGLVLGAAVVPTLLAAALAAGGLGSDGWVAAVLGTAAVVALGCGALGRVDRGRPWAAPVGVAIVAGAALAVVPAGTVLGVVAALVDRAAWAPDAGGDVVVADWLRPALDATGYAVPGGAAVGQLAGAAVLAGAVALLHRRTGRVLGALVAVGAVVVLPVAMGLSVAVTVAGLGLVVVGLAGIVRARPRDPELLAGGAATVLAGSAFAVGSAPWAVGWTIVVGLVAGAVAVEVAVRRSPDAPAWVGTAVGVVLAAVGLDAWVLGADGIDVLLAIAVAAAALSSAAALLERRDLGVAAEVVDVMVALVLALAPFLAVTTGGTVLSLSPFLVLAGVTAAGAALRPGRRPAWMVATGSAVLLAWVEVGRAGIEVVEAYTVPLAAWALVVGAVAGVGRAAHGAPAGPPLGSWPRYGLGLLTAAGPTTVLALVDPDPVRTVAVVALGTAVAVWGAAARLQAPLAIGAAAVGALAVRHLGPVGVELPRYVAFAVAGLVLLAVGATFEQRRQDLRHARDAFARLG